MMKKIAVSLIFAMIFATSTVFFHEITHVFQCMETGGKATFLFVEADGYSFLNFSTVGLGGLATALPSPAINCKSPQNKNYWLEPDYMLEMPAWAVSLIWGIGIWLIWRPKIHEHIKKLK